MDPNEALARIRAATGVISDSTASEEAVKQALWDQHEAISALDGWLSRGGFPPADWQRQSAGELAPVVLVYGDPADGFTFVGPVTPNDPDLDAFVDSQLRNVTWWYLPVRTLADVAEDLGRVDDAIGSTAENPSVDDGRECELTYKIVVNVHPEDGEPDGGLPAGAPVEFYKLPDEVGEALKDLGNEYLHEVNGVEPTSIRFLS